MADYAFDFAPLGEEWSPVRCIDHKLGTNKIAKAYIRDQFLRRARAAMPPVAADLIDLAVAVHIADRLSHRAWDVPCSIHIKLPVRVRDRFADPATGDRLASILHWFTEDKWSFEFTQRTGNEGKAGHQGQLLFATAAAPIEVALWSGGADALAGLLSRLAQANADSTFMLIGTGSNTFVQGRQRSLFGELQAHGKRWHLDKDRLHLAQVLIGLRDTRTMHKDSDLRARGFVFALIGAACAVLEGNYELMVYENGIGAINLPWRPAEIGLDHARGVHPRSLLVVSEFLSHLFGEEFTVLNPFVFNTKSEMCNALKTNRATDLVPWTVSCDRPHRLHSLPQQCGYCTSCLLRRQALTACGIEDTTDYAISARDWHPKQRESLAWAVMGQQAAMMRLCLAADDPWQAMGNHFAGLAEVGHVLASVHGENLDNVRKLLLALYSRHAREWEHVQAYIRPGAVAGPSMNAGSASQRKARHS